MKKVVERVQRENETLKKSSAPANQDKVAALEQENVKLKVVDHIMSYISYWLWQVFFSHLCSVDNAVR